MAHTLAEVLGAMRSIARAIDRLGAQIARALAQSLQAEHPLDQLIISVVVQVSQSSMSDDEMHDQQHHHDVVTAADRGFDKAFRHSRARRDRLGGDRSPGDDTRPAVAVEHRHRVVEAHTRGREAGRRTA